MERLETHKPIVMYRSDLDHDLNKENKNVLIEEISTLTKYRLI